METQNEIEQRNFFHISLIILRNSFLTVINILMLKVLTGMEEASVAQIFSTLFSGGVRRMKRMYSSFRCGELSVQRAVPLGRIVLSFYVLNNSGTYKRTLKLVRGLAHAHT